MCKERRISESCNRARVSPYPLRSSRNNTNYAPELAIQSEWEDARCVICMEPPHNAVLLQCCSIFNGCRPYMCDTSARHSNCFKQFRRNNSKNKRLNPSKTLNCPLCRGEVLETTKVTSTGRRFMNAKPRSCPVNDCEFTGTFSQLDKHLKAEHRGVVPRMVDPQRQRRWEMVQRYAEYVDVMSAARIFHIPLFVQRQLPSTHHPQMFQLNVGADGTLWITPIQVRNGFGSANYAAAFMPRLQFPPRNMYHGY